MRKKILVMIMISVLLVACQSKGGEGTQDSVDTVPTGSENKSEEENTVEVDLMTKEEFLKYVEENQDLETVDVTVEDLEGIDIDDFIEYNEFEKDDVERYSLKHALELYFEVLPFRELEPYMAKAIISVASSDEEYESFKEEYFKTINAPYEFLFLDEYDIEDYGITIGDERYRISIGQTQNLDKYRLMKDNEGIYGVEYVGDPSLLLPIAYSKNSKYFILSAIANEKECELVKIFCELED